MISFLIGILSGCSYTTSTHTIQKDLSKDQIIEINYDDVLKKINQKEDFVLYVGRPDCKDCQEFEPYLKKYLKKNKGVYLYYFNIKEYRDQANSQEATKKEKSRYNQMRKKLDFSWTPTLKLVINGKFVDQYTFLDEDYYSLPSKKQKEKKQDYIDKLSSWLDQIYQD